eukprot:4935702-Lingulodinium_polyedra.AAC.1
MNSVQSQWRRVGQGAGQRVAALAYSKSKIQVWSRLRVVRGSAIRVRALWRLVFGDSPLVSAAVGRKLSG